MSGSKGSGPRPERPWRPSTLRVFAAVRRTREVWVTDRRSGERTRRAVTRFDVGYRVDGHDFRFGFEQRGWADTFARALQEGFARGLPFDPQTRRFVDDNPDVIDDTSSGPTVVEHFVDYAHRKWRTWEPASRPHAQRDLARAALFLLREDAPPLDTGAVKAADAYLRSIRSPTVPADDVQEAEWHPWFAAWSLPLTAVSDVQLQAFLDDVAARSLDGRPRRLAPASLARTRAVSGPPSRTPASAASSAGTLGSRYTHQSSEMPTGSTLTL